MRPRVRAPCAAIIGRRRVARAWVGGVAASSHVNVPRAYAGFDAGNLFVTGGVAQGGIAYRNSQFPVNAGDRLCVAYRFE